MLSEIVKKYSSNRENKVYLSIFNTSVGELIAAADDSYIYFILFLDSKDLNKELQILVKEIDCTYLNDKNEILKKVEKELDGYFLGKIKKFNASIKMIGTDFQKEVWNKLLEVPFGSTITYGDLAKALGRKASHARAIGAACGANAHILLIPCHRIVASGSKGGFSCGINRKEWLLKHEKKFV